MNFRWGFYFYSMTLVRVTEARHLFLRTVAILSFGLTHSLGLDTFSTSGKVSIRIRNHATERS